MTKLDKIKRLCLRVLELDKEADPEWWPMHPLGGTKIYPNSLTHDSLASFSSRRNCDMAIAARSFSPAAARALLDIIAWAEEFDVAKIDKTIQAAFPDELLEDV